MNSKKTSEPSSARSAPRKVHPIATVPFSLSKDGGFKRPKDLNAGRSNDVQRSIKKAKYLQLRLRLCKLEEELKKRQEFYSESITKIWTDNDEMSEKIHVKKVALEKLTCLKDTFDRLFKEDQFISDLNKKLNNLDNDLEFLFEHIEGQTCHISLQGMDKMSLSKLNDICEALSSLDTSACSEVASLAKEVNTLTNFIGDSVKIQENLDRLKAELNAAKQEYDSLQEVEKSIHSRS